MEIWVLRIVHIFSGVFWAGYIIFAGFFFLPALREAGPAGAAVMGALTRRKLVPAVTLVSVLSLVSGLRLYAIYYNGAWLATGPGKLLSLGALAAITSFVLGFLLTVPAVRKMGALQMQIKNAGAPPTPEQGTQLAALGAKLGTLGRWNAILLTIAALCMAASRYAPL